MSLDSMFKLSLVMELVDKLSAPMSRVNTTVSDSVSGLEGFNAACGSLAQAGAAMAGLGSQILGAVMSPVQATFATERALGELASLGVKDLGLLEDAARGFSSTWAGTSTAEFITAAYDIKSGISSLTDSGIAEYTRLAGMTAKGTKSTVAEMTSLFATGYGIYKDYYSSLSDIRFAEMFSAGISESVRAFKTSGSGMAHAIQTLGGSATTANVPLEEQLAILGMLQATMPGPEAGTKYKAFLRSAVKGGEALGLVFTDTNNQLLSLPEILETLRGRFGDTMDAVEKMELQKAFGDTEAIALIDLMYNKSGQLQSGILNLYSAMGEGAGVTQRMAEAINSTNADQYVTMTQKIQNFKETLGNLLLPTVGELIDKADVWLNKAAVWVSENESLARTIMQGVAALGGFLTVGGAVIGVIGALGAMFAKIIQVGGLFVSIIKNIPTLFKMLSSGFTTLRIMALYAGDGIKVAFGGIKNFAISAAGGVKAVALSMAQMAKTAAISAATALKNVATGLVGMAKQAITTAATAMPGLIASVWSFTAALLANPITWVVVGIMLLITGLVLLYNKCEWFRNGVNAVFGAIKTFFTGVWNAVGGVMDAAKATVGEKLGNIKAAYEEHGGGIRGVMAAAMEGVKSYYTLGLTFIDNLTGGKLTELKDKFTGKFSEIRDTVGTLMEGAGQYVAGKLSAMRAAYEEHGGGIRGVMAAAMEGVLSIQNDAFNLLDGMTGGRLSAIRDTFTGGIEAIKTWFLGIPEWFRESGARIIDTFTEGIRSAAMRPVEAVSGILAQVRNYLPFSDAKTGPLSTLTLSGHRTMSTIAEGMRQAEGLPAAAMERSLGMVDAENAVRRPVDKVNLRELTHSETVYEPGEPSSRDVIIEKLFMSVDFKNMKELPQLIRLLKEIDNYANSNGLTGVPAS